MTKTHMRLTALKSKSVAVLENVTQINKKKGHRNADSRSVALIRTSQKVTQENLQQERPSFSLNPKLKPWYVPCALAKVPSHGPREEWHMARAPWKPALPFHSATAAVFCIRSSVFSWSQTLTLSSGWAQGTGSVVVGLGLTEFFQYLYCTSSRNSL